MTAAETQNPKADPAFHPETVEVDRAEVECDGGPMGHPLVYLHIRRDGSVDCPYCDRHFVLKQGAH